jgi:hypothetical protein
LASLINALLARSMSFGAIFFTFFNNGFNGAPGDFQSSGSYLGFHSKGREYICTHHFSDFYFFKFHCYFFHFTSPIWTILCMSIT